MDLSNIFKKVLIISTAVTLLSFRLMSNKSLKKKNTEPSLSQYLNRLKEFYDNEFMDLAEDKFLSFVDFGISPNAAFEMIIREGV